MTVHTQSAAFRDGKKRTGILCLQLFVQSIAMKKTPVPFFLTKVFRPS